MKQLTVLMQIISPSIKYIHEIESEIWDEKSQLMLYLFENKKKSITGKQSLTTLGPDIGQTLEKRLWPLICSHA